MSERKNHDHMPGHHDHEHHRDWHREHGGKKGHMKGMKGEHRDHEHPPTPEFEEPRLPDESGWYIPSSTHRPARGSRHILTAGTGAVLTSAAVGIFVLALVLILLAAILYRKRKLAARQQRSTAAAHRNLYISGMHGYNGPALDNPTYVVPLNDEEKKIPLGDSFMVVPREYPALLDPGTQPPSYQEALTTERSDLQPPGYSLEADDNCDAVPVLRRLSITLPGEENVKKEESC